MVIRPYLLAIGAVLPLLAPEVWSGFRLAQSDGILSVIATTEQPLSVRSPAGIWAMALALGWFSLAYWRRNITLWEVALVVVGGSAALTRLGNAWLYAAAMVLPLARQLSPLNLRPLMLSAFTAVSVGVALATVLVTRPPELPPGGRQAALASTTGARVMADWRWAGDLQRQVGAGRAVFAAGGLASESPEFWVDYLRIAQGHERWAELLRQRDVDLLVLDADDQQRAAAALVRASADWHVTFDAAGALVAERVRP
jgi:hypothetical protein